MAVIETWYNQDLQQPVKVHYLDGSLFSHNGNGNRIGVHVFNNGEPVTLSGAVSGYVVTADGSTVPCTGTRSGNSASILIPAAAYQPGAVFITVFITDGSTVTTIASVATNVMTARTENQVSPGTAVQDWTQTITAAMQSVETAAENLGGIIAVPYANITYPVPLGKYTYYEGNLYRCISPIATSESFTAAHWTQVRLGDDVSDLKSALSANDSRLDNLDKFVRKTLNYEFTNTVNVSSGSHSSSTKIIDAYIPQGQAYTIRVSTTATHGNIIIYEMHKDGTYKALSYNAAVDTDLSYTAEKETSHFNFFINGGFTSSGTFTFTVKYTITTANSIEERVDVLETAQGTNVNKSNMDQFAFVNVPASKNRFDKTQYISGKSINPLYGQITDSNVQGIYYLNVQPADVVYFWRLHNDGVIKAEASGIGVFNASGSFITNGGQTGTIYTYTVPSNVYKLGINISQNQVNNDDVMIVINDSNKPSKKDIGYNNAGYRYFDTKESTQKLNYNTFLPLSTKQSFDERILSMAHAGLSEYYPIDTELSIIGAKIAGFSCVEMDVQITSDNVYVLYHDTNMVRVGGTSSQTIENMTYSELQQFDYGSWMDSRFVGTPLCTFDNAVKVCKLLGLKIYVDCKGIQTVQEFKDAAAIVDRWGMHDEVFWGATLFQNCWDAIPDAKIIFAAGGKLTGSTWEGADGWFTNLPAMYPDKATEIDGVWKFNDDVYFGVVNTYTLMNDQTYGIEGLQTEAIKAEKYNIKYGLYAVDDVETIYTLCSSIPYMQYMEGNKIAIQNALNQHYEVNSAKYLL